MFVLTQKLIQSHGIQFAKVDAHDIEDEDSADLLWLLWTPDDPFTEGEVLEISSVTEDESLYFVALNLAYRFGGWPTSWRFTGTRDECVQAIQKVLNTKLHSKSSVDQ